MSRIVGLGLKWKCLRKGCDALTASVLCDRHLEEWLSLALPQSQPSMTPHEEVGVSTAPRSRESQRSEICMSKVSKEAMDWAHEEMKKVEQYKRDNPDWLEKSRPYSEFRAEMMKRLAQSQPVETPHEGSGADNDPA